MKGRLRVLLGAAPGVGKTYTMLEEGRRLRAEGRDVVVAFLETHGRAATAAMADGLEILARRSISHRGVELTELDTAGVIARRPDIALIDELAHTNAPGSANPKRWQDVQDVLDAGIDVISTLNIQHIESLNDVVEKITGVPQRETIPDAVLRTADQTEVVDLAPQALRDRLAGGNVYPAERIDAALSNYFRIGNLTALRELALLWLADEVDQALQHYRAEHGIDTTWEARERVVVTLTGGPEGDTLIRRAARIAARSSGGELLAVHVTSHDGLRAGNPGTLLKQRALLEELGGSYHQVLGEDIPRALVDFAKAVNATQLVIGVSRRSRLVAALTGPGIGATVTREAGNIDVHVVNHAAAGGRVRLPRIGGALSLRRRVVGLILALFGGPLLTWFPVTVRSTDTITSDVLSYQLLVVVVALIGGIWPAAFAAVMSGLTLDYFFVEPYNTITVDEPAHLLALTLYVIIAGLVSFVVDRAARQTRAARRSAAEADLLATTAGSVLRERDALHALVARTREAFNLNGVKLSADAIVLAADGDMSAELTEKIGVGTRATLQLYGPPIEAANRRLLSAIITQIEAAIQHRDLAATAREVAPLAASDRIRSALLTALSHDLRRPLAAATAAVGGVLHTGNSLSDSDRTELLQTADESLTTLTRLITDLLDVSRVQAGALTVTLTSVDPADAILPAVDELRLTPREAELDLQPNAVRADPVLLQRVIVNLLTNAIRHTPPNTPIRVSTSAFGDRVEIRIIDHGPGIPADRRDEVFLPFQRQGDTDNTTGLGLGLALAKGFTETMHGNLSIEDTPGGGVTMVLSLPADATDRTPAP
ncbi:sensor histidine kinase [Microlunatus soli]|uniref:histidine kinase n=1 Tax=Microlunatus soli TaxID=630515 RepID=A0A1H1YY98_9ACTN|nr:ATP-binding protein [Microlunatus soli]SDT26444.1 two-component system, OmpR family, sensor histidine kinase KdpD [Microlunatus soli]